MSNSTGGTTRSKPTGSQATPPAPASSEAISDVAWVADEQTREAMIRLAAYTFYERRGYVSGSELEDWLEAEMEVDRQLTATPSPSAVGEGVAEHQHTIAPVQTRARLHAVPDTKAANKAASKAPPKPAARKAAGPAVAKKAVQAAVKVSPPAETPALADPAAAAPKKTHAPKRDTPAAKPRPVTKG